MNRVLFTHSYFYKFDPKQWRFKQPYPPLGTIQAAAVAREGGFEVSVFDVALKESPEEIKTELENRKPDFLVIYDDGFNYLTKMCLTKMRNAALVMTQLAKATNTIVIVCSSDSSDHYDKYLSAGVDYVIKGEGEDTLKELLVTLKNNKSSECIQGIYYRKNGEAISTTARTVIRDLDRLPMPAWDLIDLGPYKKIWIRHHGYFSLNIATTRGCPYKCNWCAKPLYGNRYNSRSPENVIHEIQYLIKRFKPDHFWMCDDIFGLKPGWVKHFAELVKANNLKFKFKIQSRVDLLLAEDNIQALAAAGAETVWVGAESGSQKILDAMDKGTTLEQIEQATLLLKKHDIRVAFFLQFGYLGETKRDIDATLEMVLKLLPDEIGISVSYPLPGTKFYNLVKQQLKEKQNWEDSDDLAMMYQGTFSPTYYKLLHRYIHSRYRIQRGWSQLKDKKITPRFFASMLFHAPLAIAQRWRLKKLSHVAQ
jgi:anaerobic magnesium-protoporphyrin IX monomethyl ester cyclase